MAGVVTGRFTALREEPFVVFLIGMRTGSASSTVTLVRATEAVLVTDRVTVTCGSAVSQWKLM